MDSLKISAQLLAGNIPAKAAHNQSNCVSLPFNQWRSLVDGHEEDNLELQKWIRTMYSVQQPFNISTTSLYAILHYQKLSENGVSHLLRRVHVCGDGGAWERSRCVVPFFNLTSRTAGCVETRYNISPTSTETNPLNGYLPRAETACTDVMGGLCLPPPMRTFATTNCWKV